MKQIFFVAAQRGGREVDNLAGWFDTVEQFTAYCEEAGEPGRTYDVFYAPRARVDRRVLATVRP